jgi:hypothetical protein
MSEEIHGGCLCGSVRYTLQSPAVQTTLCHCSDCQKASGAPVVAWTFFHRGALSWTQGNPKTVVHAERQRSFCGDCGTPLMFFDPAIPEWFEVSTCSFDDPEPHVPADECWQSDAISWIDSMGKLSAYQKSSPLPYVS